MSSAFLAGALVLALSAPPAPPAPVRRAAVIEPTGAVALQAEGETVVDPSSTFEVELAGRMPDGRLVLLDGADAHVPATGAREVGATTKVTLAPTSPLVPGSRYVLRLDGAATRELHDEAGRAYAPVSFALLAAGTPPPARKARPRRRR